MSLSIGPGSDFIYQVLPHLVGGVHDGTYDVLDTRNLAGGPVQNHPNQPAAAFAATLLNGTLDAL